MLSNRNTRKPDVVYLIYAPEKVTWSAGIRVLYKMLDAIKESGREVYVINHGKSKLQNKIDIYRLRSELNRRRTNLVFVAVYTESTLGNPLKTARVIRWILNYPGLLAGQSQFVNEFLLAYTENIAKVIPSPNGNLPKVLFIPALSFQEIHFLKPSSHQDGNESYDLVYAQKYRSLGGIPTFNPDIKVEITRFNRKSQTREETLELVRNARSLHVYENSTIITEAQLCNVPVFCHRNEYFNELIAEVELGVEGVTWNIHQTPNCNSEAIRARVMAWETSTVERVDVILSKFEEEITFDEAGKALTFNGFLLAFRHRIARFIALAKNRDLPTAFRYLINFILRSIRR